MTLTGCTSMEFEFFLKKHVKFGRMVKCFIQSMLYRLLYIFPIFRAICEYHTSKNLPLLLRTIHRAIFSHLRTNQSAVRQVRDLSMQTSGKELSLVSKRHGVELLNWVLSTCRESVSVLSYVMEHSHEEEWLCVAAFGSISFWHFSSGKRFKLVNCCW